MVTRLRAKVIDAGPFIFSIIMRGVDALVRMSDWQRCIQDELRIARDEFHELGEVKPRFIVYTTFPEPAVMVLLPQLSDKQMVVELVREFCGDTKASAAFFITEMWFVKSDDAPTERLETVAPAKHPLRRECVMVVVDSPRIKPNQQAWHAEITRPDGKAELGDWATFQDMQGRFVNLLPPYDRTDGGLGGDA